MRRARVALFVLLASGCGTRDRAERGLALGELRDQRDDRGDVFTPTQRLGLRVCADL